MEKILDLETNSSNAKSLYFSFYSTKNQTFLKTHYTLGENDFLIRKNALSMKSNPRIKMVHMKCRIVKDNTVIPNNNVKRMSIMPGRKGLT
jgi:hypothetical protein